MKTFVFDEQRIMRGRGRIDRTRMNYEPLNCGHIAFAVGLSSIICMISVNNNIIIIIMAVQFFAHDVTSKCHLFIEGSNVALFMVQQNDKLSSLRIGLPVALKIHSSKLIATFVVT